MKKVNLYRVVYVDAAKKDRAESVCAEDIIEAANMAVHLVGVNAENIKQIQKCKIRPYIELKGE